MKEQHNICKYCGGKLVIEYVGLYGAVYPLLESGQPGKRRIRRILYEESADDPMIYCSKCKRLVNNES